MPLDLDIMLGSSPPLMGQSPLLSYFNSLAQSRATSYSHFDTDEKSRPWSSSSPNNNCSSSVSTHNYNKTTRNGASSFYYSDNNNNNNNNKCNRNQFKTRNHHRSPQRTSSLPSTLFTRPILDATNVMSGGQRRPSLDSPLRSCILVRNDVVMVSPSTEQQKKRVVFADDRGLSLEHVRIMQEPSDDGCPPCWDSDFLDCVLGRSDGLGNYGSIGTINGQRNSLAWELKFAQPAANYRQFRDHLENDNVALENVIVKSDSDEISGCVKVRNLGFQKEVIVRWTADDWKTFEDVSCTYLPSGAEGTSVIHVFDTFRFAFCVPKAGKMDKDGQLLSRLSLCVCYRAHDTNGDSQEYWDNNNGANFVMEAPKVPKSQPQSPPPPPSPQKVSLFMLHQQSRNLMAISNKVTDAQQAKVTSWSEFASWNHLTNDAPYW